MCICGALRIGVGISKEFFCPRLQDGPAPPFHFLFPAGQPLKEVADFYNRNLGGRCLGQA